MVETTIPGTGLNEPLNFQGGGGQTRILVADDNQARRNDLVGFLRFNGYNVVGCQVGQAREFFDGQNFLIASREPLIGRNFRGDELILELKKNPGNYEMKVIALSDRVDPIVDFEGRPQRDAADCHYRDNVAGSVDAYLTRPFDKNLLLAIVKRLEGDLPQSTV